MEASEISSNINRDEPLDAAGLREILMQTPLSNRDMSAILYLYGDHQDNPEVIEPLSKLVRLAHTDLAERKVLERRDAETVDLMQTLEGFSPLERDFLIKRINEIQLTEGCTGACPFCQLMSHPHVEAKFTLESFRRFVDSYGAMLPKHLVLYSKSDPFDWVDGDNTYLELLDILAEQDPGIMPFTSTAVPLGTEFSVMRYIKALHHVWEQEPDFSVKRYFRISKTGQNAPRIDLMFDLLRAQGLPQDFIDSIKVSDRQPDKLYNAGYYIDKPDRKVLQDINGINMCDEVSISPRVGVVSGVVEIVTALNPTGMREEVVLPGSVTVPVHMSLNDYDCRPDSTGERNRPDRLFRVVPEARYGSIDAAGNITTSTRSSVGRDALTFTFAYLSCTDFAEGMENGSFKDANVMASISTRFHTDFVPEFEQRCASYIERRDQEEDREAVHVADVYMAEAREKIEVLKSSLKR